MTSFIYTNSRNDGRIKSRIKGQKPACIIKIFPWENPAILGMEVLNLSSDGGFFTDRKIQNQARNARQSSVVDNDIVRCSINKAKNSSSGAFSFILKRGNKGDNGQKVSNQPIDYLKVISPGDWVAIYMKSDGVIDINGTDSESGLKLLGIIENIRYVEIDDPSLGKPRLEYVVTGRDFGKILESEIYFNPLIASMPELQSAMGAKFNVDALAQFGKGPTYSPDQIIKSMLRFYVGGDLSETSRVSQQWFVPSEVAALFKSGASSGAGSVPFYNLLNQNYIGTHQYNSAQQFSTATPLLGSTLVLSAPTSGTVWSAMQSYANLCLNEFVVDLKKTKVIGQTKDGRPKYKLEPCVQLRQLPYSNTKASETSVFYSGTNGTLEKMVPNIEKTFYLNLPRHVLQSTDLKQKNIGKSDFERINSIIITPGLLSTEPPLQQAYRMAINIPSVQRYGSRFLNASSFYTAGSDIVNYTTKCVSLLSDFFMTAHLMYNGTIVATGTDEFVEVGQNLYIEDIQQLFHIEGISYIYEINQEIGSTTYNTEFRVSRGVRVQGGQTRFIDNSVSRAEEDLYSTIVTNSFENVRNVEKESNR